MMEVGRLCVKIAGRDAGKRCVIIDVLEDGRVMVDGVTRRRKCNVSHLEPMKETLDLKKGASHADVVKAFSKMGVTITESKPKKAKERPRQVRSKQRKKMAEESEKKKPAKEKKEVPKEVKEEQSKKEAEPKEKEPKSVEKTEKK